MIVKVSGSRLCKVLTDFVRSSKVMFNFRCNGNKMDIQILNEYTVLTSIPVESLDNDFREQDISVYLTKAINILSKDDDVIFTFNEACLNIEQGAFSCMFIREFEARREYPDTSMYMLLPLGMKLKYLVSSVVGMGSLSKELKVLEPDPIILRDHFYQKYPSTVFRDTYEFPGCSIALKTLKDIVYRLDDKAVYHYDEQTSIIYIKDKDYNIWIPTADYNVSGNQISAIDKKIEECKPCTTIKIKDYLYRFKVMTDAYPAQKLVLTIGEESVRVALNVTNANLTVGDDISTYLFSMNITSAQLSVICKLFGEEDSIEILRGGNAICLRSDKTKNLLIVGTIF